MSYVPRHGERAKGTLFAVLYAVLAAALLAAYLRFALMEIPFPGGS